MSHRAYDDHWTTELFSNIDMRIKQGYDQYQIKSSDNSPFSGWFHAGEFQVLLMEHGETEMFEIDKILKRRQNNQMKY